MVKENEGLTWDQLNETIDRLRGEAKKHADSKSPTLRQLSRDLFVEVAELEAQREAMDPRPHTL